MQSYLASTGGLGGGGRRGGGGGGRGGGNANGRYAPMDSRFDPRYDQANQQAGSTAGSGVGGRTAPPAPPVAPPSFTANGGFGYDGASQGSLRSYPQSQGGPFTQQQGGFSGHFNLGMGGGHSQAGGSFTQASDRMSYGGASSTMSQDSYSGDYDYGHGAYGGGGRSSSSSSGSHHHFIPASQGPMSQEHSQGGLMSQDPRGR